MFLCYWGWVLLGNIYILNLNLWEGKENVIWLKFIRCFKRVII